MKRVLHYVSLLVLLCLVGFATNVSAQALSESDLASKEAARLAYLGLQQDDGGVVTKPMRSVTAAGNGSLPQVPNHGNGQPVNVTVAPMSSNLPAVENNLPTGLEKMQQVQQNAVTAAPVASVNQQPTQNSQTVANPTSVNSYLQLAAEFAALYPQSLTDISVMSELYQISQQMAELKANAQ